MEVMNLPSGFAISFDPAERWKQQDEEGKDYYIYMVMGHVYRNGQELGTAPGVLTENDLQQEKEGLASLFKSLYVNHVHTLGDLAHQLLGNPPYDKESMDNEDITIPEEIHQEIEDIDNWIANNPIYAYKYASNFLNAKDRLLCAL